jgi:signal transduction histidine kinase
LEDDKARRVQLVALAGCFSIERAASVDMMTSTPSRGSPPTDRAVATPRGDGKDASRADPVRIFASGLAHAFSNVLSGIIGFGQLAKHDIKDPVAAAAHLEDLLRATQRARDVLQQVLVFSRVQERVAKEVSLGTFIADALPRWRATVPPHIEIRTRIDPNCPPVFADPDQLERAVGCLLANAARAIGESGGCIEISLATGTTSAAEASPLRSSSRYVRLSVSDNGSGIKAEVVDQIFEPFFTTLPMGRGIGLGLAIVEAIVTAAGGIVRVETEPGRGTNFHLSFPVLT